MLEISTQEPEREKISVDGTEYELATRDDLSISESSYMAWVGKQIQGVEDVKDFTEDLGEKLEDMLYKAGRIVVRDMPEEVYKKLNDNHRIQIINAFGSAEGVEGEAPSQNSNG